MATANDKTYCVKCSTEKTTFRCGGCLQEYYYKYLEDHRQELNKPFDDIEVNHLLNLWNNQISLCQFQEELEQLKNPLIKPSNILIRNISTPFIDKIAVIVSNHNLNSIPNESAISKSNIHHNTRWSHNGVTVPGGNGYGNLLNQLSSPCGMFVDDDQSIYVADKQNHRIVLWKFDEISGQVIAGENGQGNELNKLNNPTDVIVDRESNSLIICDQGNRRVVR